MKGIEEGYELPREAEDDVWSLTERERKALGISPLPRSLWDAIGIAEDSELLAETLGEHVFDFFLRNKRAEWEEYRTPGLRLRARPDAAGPLSPAVSPIDVHRAPTSARASSTEPRRHAGSSRSAIAGLPRVTDELAASADRRRRARRAAAAGRRRSTEQCRRVPGGTMLAEVADDEGTAMRLCSVLGAQHGAGPPPRRATRSSWRELTDPTLGSTRPAAYALREAMLTAVGADPHADEPVAGLPDDEAVDALRVEYRRHLLRLASRDLAHHVGLDDAAAEISDLAGATLDGALAVARARVGEPAHAVRGSRSSRWASAVATSSTTSPTSTWSSSTSRRSRGEVRTTASRCGPPPSWPRT